MQLVEQLILQLLVTQSLTPAALLLLIQSAPHLLQMERLHLTPAQVLYLEHLQILLAALITQSPPPIQQELLLQHSHL
jgi:hypothetical protein